MSLAETGCWGSGGCARELVPALQPFKRPGISPPFRKSKLAADGRSPVKPDQRRVVTYLTCLAALAFVLAVGISGSHHGCPPAGPPPPRSTSFGPGPAPLPRCVGE